MEKATRQQTKEHNTALVLKTIYQSENISRAEIARTTRLTRTTVSDIVGELIAAGLVQEIGVGAAANGGKPPIQVQLSENSRQLICVDLSNDQFRGALTDLRGNFLYEESVSLENPMGQEALEGVYRLIDRLLHAAGAPILGIGIGAPGLIDTTQGVVRQSVNRGWQDLPLGSLLEQRYRLPIYLANDSHIAALAEYTFGERQVLPNLVLIKVGEGIGSGIVLNGHIFTGDGFSAGEIGHLSVEKGGRLCNCGNHGCLETVASTRSLLHAARPLLLGEQSQAGLSLEDVRRAYAAHHAQVNDLVASTAAFLGDAVAYLIGVMNVSQVVIAGAPVAFGESYLEAVRAEARQRVLPAMAAGTTISFSRLGENIVLRGASALVLSKELDLP